MILGIIGFIVGWGITLFILIYFDRDEIWYRKTKKIRLPEYTNKSHFIVGNINNYLKWNGERLEIKGGIKS